MVALVGFFFMIFIFIVFVWIVNRLNGKNRDFQQWGPNSPMHNLNNRNTQNNSRYNSYQNPFNVDENSIEAKIQATDELFNKAEFLSYASDLFIKLQYAWSDRNLEEVRVYETPELFEQTQSQINRYINAKQINKIERVSVNVAKLYSFEQQGDRECLSIILESKMIDYIIDETTSKVLKGDPNLNKVNSYILTFVRKQGSKTESDGKVTKSMNCPNCGAPTTVTSTGKCPYCGSLITTRDSSWSLSSLKRYNVNM